MATITTKVVPMRSLGQNGDVTLEARALKVGKLKAMTFETWSGTGSWIGTVHGAVQWWAGDWCNLGEERFGEDHSQALDALGIELATLQQYAWVARNIPAERRIYNLPWSSYREVADLKAKEQQTWLARAEEGDDGVPWTAERLRRELRDDKGDGDADGELWVMAKCSGVRDQSALLKRLEGEGRVVKAVAR